MVTDLTNPARTCYITFMRMPEEARPAQVGRTARTTVLGIDPRTTCLEIVAWCVDNLTTEELNYYRAAYDEPPVGQPLSEEWMQLRRMEPRIPDSLVLPQHQARQTA